MTPYLSIVMGIGGTLSLDLLERLYNSTNNTIALAERTGLSMELVIVEWNMTRKIDYSIFPKTEIPIRVIHTEDAHNRVANPYGFRYFEWYPKNIGIRRAEGEFVLSTNPDDIFSLELFEHFAQRRLRNGYFYRVNRWDYRDGQVYAICRNDGVFWPGDPLPKEDYDKIHYCASGDFTLMSKEDWYLIHGNPERTYNHTVDGQTLFVARQSGLCQRILPFPIYHPDHARTLNHAFMPDWSDDKPHGVMNKDWGFEDETFPETRVFGNGSSRFATLPSIPSPHIPKWRIWPDPKPEDVILIRILNDHLRKLNGEYVYLERKFAERWIKTGHAKLGELYR